MAVNYPYYMPQQQQPQYAAVPYIPQQRMQYVEQPQIGIKGRPVSSNEELSSTMMKKVLCHELTHAAMFSYGIELSFEQEELLADLIATYGQEIINMTNSIFNRLKKDGELN